MVPSPVLPQFYHAEEILAKIAPRRWNYNRTGRGFMWLAYFSHYLRPEGNQFHNLCHKTYRLFSLEPRLLDGGAGSLSHVMVMSLSLVIVRISFSCNSNLSWHIVLAPQLESFRNCQGYLRMTTAEPHRHSQSFSWLLCKISIPGVCQYSGTRSSNSLEDPTIVDFSLA